MSIMQSIIISGLFGVVYGSTVAILYAVLT